jgi:uncharacterized protein (DUF4415 family)
MRYTWDSLKSEDTLRERGFDFLFATQIFDTPSLGGRVAAMHGSDWRMSKRRKEPSRGRADLARLRRMSEAEIARTSPPELADLPDDFWDAATLVEPPDKRAISLRVDEDVLDWFKSGGPRYQTRMNAVLRSYVRAMSRRDPARRGQVP